MSNLNININNVTATDASRLVVTINYLEVLNRAPTMAELFDYATQIEAGTLTSEQLVAILRGSYEFLILNGEYAGNAVYDDPTWTLSLNDIYPANYHGATLANGKLALITDPSHNRMSQSFISTSFDTNTFGTYVNNVVKTFQYTTLNMFQRDEADVAITDVTQSLVMSNGNFRVTYDAETNDDKISVTHDITPLRPFPYCVLQTVTISSPVPLVAQDMLVYHTLETPDNIENVRYGNNIITVYNAQNVPTPVQFFNASGYLKNSASAPTAGLKAVTTSCCYLFPTGSTYSNQGYNIQRTDTGFAYNIFKVRPQQSQAGAPFKFTFHILSATMTQFDFEYPDVETQRILVNLVSRPVASIFADNTAAWAHMWQGNVTIEPKSAITQAELEAVTEFKRNLKFALYNIYAVIRDDVNVEINPLNLSTIDLTGHIFWSAELWLLPVLLLFKPRAARTLLDYRHFNLGKAQKLAAAQGYKGSKFAYENDTVGYNDVYWDTVSPLTVFNTALISISSWNYYRVSRDSDWLRKKGYDMLRNNADFFVSKLELDATGDGLYHMRNVVGMNNKMGDDNVMTNYLANMAIKYAIEAAYEINYTVDPAWKAVLNRIYIPVREVVNDGEATYYNILPIDAGYAPTPNTPGEEVKFIESMVVIHPFYSRDFFNTSVQYSVATMHANTNYYLTKLSGASATNGVNLAILGAIHGTMGQQETEYAARDADATAFYSNMQALFAGATIPPWNTMYNSLYKKSFNDIAVSASFVLGVVTSLAGLRVAGGINEARFLYEDYGIKSRTANVMPKTWKKMTVTGVGWTGSTYTITNAQYYP
jgi:trehalose/maltose hydrolase-like predicted phosphorylase